VPATGNEKKMKKNGEKIWKRVNHCFIFAPAFAPEKATAMKMTRRVL
jgi:anthranilate phosphoribosyltransferase